MKPTQRQVEQEAHRLFHAATSYLPDDEKFYGSLVNSRDWEDLARHVLRRIAAAERRGASKTHKREFNAFYKRWEAKKGTR